MRHAAQSPSRPEPHKLGGLNHAAPTCCGPLFPSLLVDIIILRAAMLHLQRVAW
jgi:hypothetical protein